MPTAKASPLLWVEVNVATPQLSLAEGAGQLTTAEQLPASLDWLTLDGIPEITGASSSVTVTAKLAEVELPAASMAVYVTVVVPTAKASPIWWVDVKLSTPQLSLAVGAVQLTTALHAPASAVWVMLAGIPEMTGTSTSFTVTVKLPVVWLPAASVAV